MRDNIRGFLMTPARYVRAIEYLLSVATIMWGSWLALPPDVFSRAVSWQALRESWLPEWAWGLLFVTLGMIKLVAVIRRWQRVRQWAAFAAMTIWSGVGLSFFGLNVGSPGWTPYIFLFAGFNALTFLRLMVQREA